MYSTASNCPTPVAPPAPPNDVTEDKAAKQDQVAGQGGAQDVDKERPSTSTKRKTKSQTECDDALDKIYKLAQAEDHPVELALIAIAKQIRHLLCCTAVKRIFTTIFDNEQMTF